MQVPSWQPGGREDCDPALNPAIRRLLLWYPRAWRARYGEEFAELLAAERAERGRSLRASVNVAAAGLRARLAAAGLAGHPLDDAAAALAGATMWSQVAIGVQWSVPRDHAITPALDVMSAALAVLVLLAVLAAAPVAWTAIAAAVRGQGRSLRWPAVFMATGLMVLVIGGRHFENGWPGTGGHLLAHQGFVPGGVAAFAWASTMWITSYWAHPAALAAFPATQLGWMLVSPAAAGSVITGAVAVLRRVRLSRRAFGYEIWLASLAWTGLAAFLCGALCWLARGGTGSPVLFRAGAIDRVAFAVLLAAVLVGALALRQARATSRPRRVPGCTAPRQ